VQSLRAMSAPCSIRARWSLIRRSGHPRRLAVRDSGAGGKGVDTRVRGERRWTAASQVEVLGSRARDCVAAWRSLLCIRYGPEGCVNIFVAGGSGAIGRVLVPLLVSEGHKVVALTRFQKRAALLDTWVQCQWSVTCSTRRSWRA
jgi:hypothetical protein